MRESTAPALELIWPPQGQRQPPKTRRLGRTDARETAAITLPGSPAASAIAGVRLNEVNRTRSTSSVDDAASSVVKFLMGIPARKERTMTKAIRFYWRGQEASIPLGKILKQDRTPLRIRRSVAQEHTHSVVEQLDEGQFVAAAWEVGGQIHLILCHPNIAKGSADPFVVNTHVLPQLVLRLTGWDQAPEVSRLFLRAFGSEAANIDECVAARRELAGWLASNGQPEMSKIVKHYSTFPFDVRSDALEVINIWRKISVEGQKEQIDQFLSEIDQRFAALGWSRDSVIEAKFNQDEHQINHHHCWSAIRDDRPRVMLSLNRTTERRVRGGTYDIKGDATLADLASVIQHILREVLEPGATAVGLRVAYPRLGPISRIGPKTQAAMTAFVEAGDGQWPLPQQVGERWRILVLTAFREDVALKPEELTAFFAANGWDEQAATELTNRFYADVALISEFQEAERQPA
jgi:hypothetical protein